MKISYLFSVSLLCSTTLLPATAADNTASNQHSDKKRIVQLIPQWSLPFQGQLVVTPPPVTASTANSSSSAATNGSQKTSAASDKNELSLFKQQKYAVLTIAPPVVPNSRLIASAESVDPKLNIDQDGKLITITGGVSAWDGPFDADRIINHLVDSHFENSPQGQKLDKQVKRLNTLKYKALAIAKDGVNQTIEYQGIEPSMRAGRLIADSHDYKIRNNAWAEYERQRYIDQIHFQVVSSLMEIAEGLGNSETERGVKSVAAGREALAALVGEDESAHTVTALTLWLNNMPPAYATFAQVPWTTLERSKKQEEVLKAAVERDEVISKVTQKVYRYAHPSKTFQYSSNFIQTTLDAIALLAPGVIPSVSAGVAEVAFKLGTGGTELNKLERELLLDKRIQSRLKVLTQESSLALDNYRYALLTKNLPLMAFSDEVIGNLTGKHSGGTKLVSAQSTVDGGALVPEIKETSPDKDRHRLVKIPLVN